MRRCFKFQVYECPNASIAKFSLKIPTRSENMDKIQTKFPRCGIFP